LAFIPLTFSVFWGSTAARMGINRTTLISRMKKLGIDPRQYAT
jgi:DNA-binding NtrC family response regulator